MLKELASDNQAHKCLVNALRGKLSKPTISLPNTFIVRRGALIQLLTEIRKEEPLLSHFTAERLLKFFVGSALITPLSSFVPSPMFASNSLQLYCISLGGDSYINPLEVLVASQRQFLKSGVCYFSAIQYHELSDQIPTHHHVATIGSKNRGITYVADYKTIGSMGQLMFTWQGTPYYLTQRDDSNLIAVDTIQFSTRGIARITSLEQTLVDCMHRPWHCGGPSVVFEAWENGLARFNQTKFVDVLEQIGYDVILRRIGALFDILGFDDLNVPLKSLLDKTRQQVHQTNPPIAPLFPSLNSDKHNPAWNISYE